MPSDSPSSSTNPSLDPSDVPSSSAQPSNQPSITPTETTAGPVCGDGNVEATEECDPPSFPTCSTTCQNLSLEDQFVSSNACVACTGGDTNKAVMILLVMTQHVIG